MAKSSYSKVDEYGFRRPDNFDYDQYDAFMSRYMRVLTRRSQRWNSAGPALFRRPAMLKRFVRKGVPGALRASVWMRVSGAEALKRTNPSYDSLKRTVVRSPRTVESIEIDLPRTFPDNIYFTSDERLPRMLFDVLVTFAHHNKDVGYCQGLNYIAGLLLLATRDEEASFWLLRTLIERILPQYYVVTMSGLITDLEVLDELVLLYEPTVHRHIRSVGMPWAMGTTKWFVCLFSEVLPTETVFRIWDCLFLEGSKVIFRAAIALIRLHRREILEADELGEMIARFKDMRNHRDVVDCHRFISDVFRLSGNLSNATIEKLRAKHRKN